MQLLNIKLKFDDVAVLHNIGLSFGAEEASFADGFFGAKSLKIVVIADLSSDKSAFEISMDGAGGFWCGGAFFDGPGATFFFAGSKE